MGTSRYDIALGRQGKIDVPPYIGGNVTHLNDLNEKEKARLLGIYSPLVPTDSESQEIARMDQEIVQAYAMNPADSRAVPRSTSNDRHRRYDSRLNPLIGLFPLEAINLFQDLLESGTYPWITIENATILGLPLDASNEYFYYDQSRDVMTALREGLSSALIPYDMGILTRAINTLRQSHPSDMGLTILYTPSPVNGVRTGFLFRRSALHMHPNVGTTGQDSTASDEYRLGSGVATLVPQYGGVPIPQMQTAALRAARSYSDSTASSLTGSRIAGNSTSSVPVSRIGTHIGADMGNLSALQVDGNATIQGNLYLSGRIIRTRPAPTPMPGPTLRPASALPWYVTTELFSVCWNKILIVWNYIKAWYRRIFPAKEPGRGRYDLVRRQKEVWWVRYLKEKNER